jgi:hypothetical protein
MITRVPTSIASAAAVATLAAVGCMPTGCGGHVPVALDSFRDGYGVMAPSERTAEVLDDAFAFWGVPYELTDDRGRGVVHVTLVDVAAGLHYRGTGWRAGCRASIVADEDPEVLRHELGHVWGLGHVDDEDNLMHPYRGDGETLTDDQRDRAHDTMQRFLACE